MKAALIVELLKSRKGQHVQLAWKRVVKTLKSFDGLITKKTTAYVRSGISYANLQDVKNAIERGVREEVESLPWGQWRVGAVNYIIDHKDTEYVRLYPAVFDNLKPVVEWRLNDEVVDYAAVEPFILAAEKQKEESSTTCFTVKANDVIYVG